MKTKVHWMVKGAPVCGESGTGVEVDHQYDERQLQITCGRCCYLFLYDLTADEYFLNQPLKLNED